MQKIYLNTLTKGKTNMENLDMNANRLKTEEQKIHWLENEIKDLEYVLSSDCINRNLKLNQLQMYREHLDMLKNNQTETKLELEEEKILTMCNIACEEFFKQPAITDILKMAPVENLAHDIAEELVTHAWSLLKADETNNNSNKMIWHPYKDCSDAPHVQEHQKETFLCKVQRFSKDNEEPIGAPSYQVCVCDDNGSFFGMRSSDDLCWAKVIAWTDIVPTTIGETV